jgi:hypothetical protein
LSCSSITVSVARCPIPVSCGVLFKLAKIGCRQPKAVAENSITEIPEGAEYRQLSFSSEDDGSFLLSSSITKLHLQIEELPVGNDYFISNGRERAARMLPFENLRNLAGKPPASISSHHDLVRCDRIFPDTFSSRVIDSVRHRRRSSGDTDLSNAPRSDGIEFNIRNI